MPGLDLASAGTAWVLGTVLKATLLLLAVTGAALLLRRASASVRHLVWSVGVVGVLALPPMSLAIPWRFAVVRIAAPTTTAGVAASDVAGPTGGPHEPGMPVEPAPVPFPTRSPGEV